MNTIWAVTKREFRAYFSSPIAYVFLTTYVVLTGFLFFRSFFLIGQAEMRPFFLLMPWIFLFYVPAVSMGKWSEERRQGTLEFLLTLPIRERDVVLGKFLAGLGLIVAALTATLPIAFTIAFLGNIDAGSVFGGYLGLIFLGGAYLSIGLVVSSLTHNQIISFIVTVVISFLFLVLGEPIFTIALPKIMIGFVQYMGLNFHFVSIGRGVIDSRDLIYYLSVIGFFLWVNKRIVEVRR